MQRLLAVDGQNLLLQMYYGMPSRVTSRDGRYVHGTFGFIGMLLKLVRTFQPDCIVVIFGRNSSGDSTEVNPENQADQSVACEEEGDPFSQLADLYVCLDYLGVQHVEAQEYEADDLLAALAQEISGQAQQEMVIVSSDSDLLQLVNPQVSVYVHRGKRSIWYREKEVWERYHVHPSQMADFKALVGDRSDKLAGMPGVGNKTAAKLLADFGSLHVLLNNVYKVPVRLRDSLSASKEHLLRNYAQIRLDGKAPLPFELRSLTRHAVREEYTVTQVLRDNGIL